MNTTKLCCCFILWCQLSFVQGQPEYLAIVDPSTGNLSLIDSLPGVNYIYNHSTAFDQNNKRYIFYGIDFNGKDRLYCFDAVTGAKLSEPIALSKAGELHYDHTSNKLYGIYFLNGVSIMSIAAIDIPSATITVVRPLPFWGYMEGISSFDDENELFFLVDADQLYAVNVITGNLNTTPIPVGVSGVQYDHTIGKIYGLQSGTPLNLVRMDPNSGQMDTVISLSLQGFETTSVTYDETNSVYTFSSSGQLYSIDVNTGAILSNTAFPVVQPGENVIELHYDDTNGTLYALHWSIPQMVDNHDLLTGESICSIFPNPVSDNQQLQVSLDNNFLGKVHFEIIGLDGRVLAIFEKEKTAQKQVFELQHLPEGNEFAVRVSCGQEKMTRVLLKR